MRKLTKLLRDNVLFVKSTSTNPANDGLYIVLSFSRVDLIIQKKNKHTNKSKLTIDNELH